MIPKHGRIHPLKQRGRPNAHLTPIQDFITKGIADARESIVLQPQACDVKGAKRHNPQQCVIAKALHRVYKPQAVAVGRSMAFAVFNGLAVRFRMPPSAQKLVQEFDQRGRARNAPIELSPVSPAWRLGNPGRKPAGKKRGEYRQRTRKIGVRAVGGGITA